MKTKLSFVSALLISGLFIINSCDLLDNDSNDLGGDPSPMGEVDNTFQLSTITGVSNTQAKVTEQDGDVSTITYSATFTDATLLALASSIPDVTVNGNTVSVNRKYRITTDGFQSVYDEGNLTIINYGAKVGDKYTLKHDGNTLVREVTEVSKEDDYAWGFMLIKTIHVEETGRNIPGVSKVEFIGNHKWGMVGIVVYFEDGSTKKIGIFSDANN